MNCNESNIFFGIMLLLTIIFIIRAHIALSVRERDTKRLIQLTDELIKKRKRKKSDIKGLLSIRGNHD